nr:hypothetical protein [uncultured Sphingomonas sp.]
MIAMDKHTVRAIAREISILVLIVAALLVALADRRDSACANAQVEARP